MMQLSKKGFAALVLVALLAAPGAALADGYSRHHGHDWRGDRYRWQEQHHYGYADHYDRHRHAGRFHAAPLHGPAYALVPPWPSYGGYGCHAVAKLDYYMGYRARVGGTLCYDAYGRAFIVPGSRYLIGYVY